MIKQKYKRKCKYCNGTNVKRRGFRYLKDEKRVGAVGFNRVQRWFCHDCKKCFSRRYGKSDKIYRMRKHPNDFYVFLEVVEEMKKCNEKISYRRISYNMLHRRAKRCKVSHKTIGRWLKKCFPELIKGVVDEK